MRLEYMETVLLAAKYHSFKKAADAIPCACSTVTKQIMAVEAELQTELFKRSANNKQVELTEDGEKALVYIRRIVTQYRKLKDELMSGDNRPRRDKLIIGVDGNLMGSAAISNMISEFYIMYPKIQLNIMRTNFVHGQELLRKGTIHGLLVLNYYWENEEDIMEMDDDMVSLYVGDERISLMAAQNNSHLTGDSYTLREIKTEKFLFGTSLAEQRAMLDRSSGNRVYGNFIKACGLHGFVPNIVKVDVPPEDANLMDIKISLIVRGKGVSISMIPRPLRENEHLKYMDITDMPYCARYFLVKRAGTDSGSVNKFFGFMKCIFDGTGA